MLVLISVNRIRHFRQLNAGNQANVVKIPLNISQNHDDFRRLPFDYRNCPAICDQAILGRTAFPIHAADSSKRRIVSSIGAETLLSG
jgi:hypothetical protein